MGTMDLREGMVVKRLVGATLMELPADIGRVIKGQVAIMYRPQTTDHRLIAEFLIGALRDSNKLIDTLSGRLGEDHLIRASFDSIASARLFLWRVGFVVKPAKRDLPALQLAS